jgi:hypothetical protein
MKNLKITMSPPYRPSEELYKSKMELTVEFEDETEAFAFNMDLLQCIAKFKVSITENK